MRRRTRSKLGQGNCCPLLNEMDKELGVRTRTPSRLVELVVVGSIGSAACSRHRLIDFSLGQQQQGWRALRNWSLQWRRRACKAATSTLQGIRNSHAIFGIGRPGPTKTGFFFLVRTALQNREQGRQ